MVIQKTMYFFPMRLTFNFDMSNFLFYFSAHFFRFKSKQEESGEKEQATEQQDSKILEVSA